MSNHNNNLLHTGNWQHANDVSHDMIHVSLTPFVLGSTSDAVGPIRPFVSIQERVHASPFALVRASSQPPMQNLSRNTNMPRDAHPRPRFTSQSPTMAVADPISVGDEQNKGLEKLRREIYNPGLQRLSLYYRDYNSKVGSREKHNNDDGKTCVVCLDDFEPREMVTLTPCNHMFHDNCIVPWVKSHGQCPVCRFVISDRTKESQGPRTHNNSELGNDPFARQLISFIRTMETRG